MHVCVCLCMWDCVYVYVAVCTYTYVSICMSGYLHVCVCLWASVCVWASVNVFVCMSESVSVCVCVCAPTPTPPVLCTGPSECCYGKSSLLDTCHTLAKATRKSWSSSPVEDGWTHLRTARGRCMTEDFLQFTKHNFPFQKISEATYAF